MTASSSRGKLAGKPTVILAIEGAFQGGSMGEVSGSKIAASLALARRDGEAGKPVLPVLLLETGGVRLQEANLGEAVVAEIHAEIIALRRHVPVIGVITGMVGCFGGMSIAASLCSYLVVLRQARFELNGPEVIEQEAGIDELDASDRRLIWSLIGGEQRYRDRIRRRADRGRCRVAAADHSRPLDPGRPRQAQDRGGRRLSPAPVEDRSDEPAGRSRVPPDLAERRNPMSAATSLSSRGWTWFDALADGAQRVETGLDSLLVADATLVGERVRLLAVVPDPRSRFPRARHGEIGLEEGWRSPATSATRSPPIAAM